LLIRAVGPSLSPFVGAGAADDPRLELFAGPNRVAENDNWGGAGNLADAMARVGAFALVSAASRDAVFAGTFANGDHSVRISASGGGTGTVLAEVYALPAAGGSALIAPRLVNVSVLKALGTGVTVGFVVAGPSACTVVIRAVGPALGAAPFNLGGVAADPQLVLYAGTTPLRANNDWGGEAALAAAFAQVGAFALPAGSRDAALVATLAPGNYSVHVSPVGAAPGSALVELYEMR
jgi:hypothetical protein